MRLHPEGPIQIVGGIANRFGGFDGAPRSEYRQSPEQLLFRRIQQFITPFDRRPKRLLTLRNVEGAAGEQVQAALQTRQHCGGRKELNPCRSQFDSQRQAVQARADVRYGVAILFGETEIRLQSRSPLQE